VLGRIVEWKYYDAQVRCSMKKTILFVLLVLVCTPRLAPTVESESPAPHRVRIGVEMQTGFQSCIDFWQPIANDLSKAIPEYRFVVVPLASRVDLLRTLEKREIDFAVVNAALDAVVSDRYGTTSLTTMMKSYEVGMKMIASDATCSGAVIRRADRSDIKGIRDIRGKRFSAVMPWSLTGWLVQWELFRKHGMDPHTDLKQVVFEGTPEQVVESVLDGSADAGAVDADLLNQMARNKRIPDNSLCVINRKGQAVPLVVGEDTASTDAYLRWAFSKAADTDDQLARRVADALMTKTLNIVVDGTACQVGWTIPQNNSKVRRLLRELMGPQFAESDGYPMPQEYPTWLFPVLAIGSGLALFTVAFMFLRGRYRRRESSLEERLEKTRKELIEVRANRQRVDAILALAGCGIDIVDDENQVVYADSSLKRQYGDWHGYKCHEYYCGADRPCSGCRRPSPTDQQSQTFLDLDGSEWATAGDPHAKVHYIEGEEIRMIGIPFRDEGGRWLYARIHIPLKAFSASKPRSLAEPEEVETAA